MREPPVDQDRLKSFERTLDPRQPHAGAIPATVLGFGEISAVLQIGDLEDGVYAYKRMPMFESVDEVEAYAALYREYLERLDRVMQPRLPGETLIYFWDHRGKWVTVYVVQERFDKRAIGSRLVHTLPDGEIIRLFASVTAAMQQVFAYNERHKGRIELGFDAQISNWAVANLTAQGTLPADIELVYLDTNTPLMRKLGQEQLNRELFLRSAPSFLRPVARALFLEEVSTRYYDVRKVAVDLLANLFKEQRADLLPLLLPVVNETVLEPFAAEPITLDEVRRYYREDAFIWRFYLALRKLDRRLHELRGRPYPFILPESVQR